MRCKFLLHNFQIVFYKLKIKSSNESNSKINTISPNISNILYSDSIPLHKILSQILSYPNTDITYKKKDHTIMKPHFYWRLIFCFLHARFNWQIKIATLRKNSKRLSFEKKGKEIETFKSQKESERHWCMISVAPLFECIANRKKKVQHYFLSCDYLLHSVSAVSARIPSKEDFTCANSWHIFSNVHCNDKYKK